MSVMAKYQGAAGGMFPAASLHAFPACMVHEPQAGTAATWLGSVPHLNDAAAHSKAWTGNMHCWHGYACMQPPGHSCSKP